MASRLTKLQQLRSDGPVATPTRTTQSLCDDFIAYLRGECHLAENSIEAYGRDLKRFLAGHVRRPVVN